MILSPYLSRINVLARNQTAEEEFELEEAPQRNPQTVHRGILSSVNLSPISPFRT